MSIGLNEIASQSGVSRSTVSRVINNDPRVSPETRLRVQTVIQELNYQPNPIARSLAGGHSRIIGLVIPTGIGRIFTDPYFPLLIQGVSSACNTLDYSVMLWLAEPEYERRTIHQIIHNHLLDGVIIASMVMDDPLIGALTDSAMPFILIGRHPTDLRVNYVDVDNFGGAREMVSFFLRVGYQKIAAITGPLRMIPGLDRLEGYKAALNFRGIPIDGELIEEGDFSEESGYLAMQRLLPHAPDAVFAASDAMAVGAMRAIEQAGLQVPRDIAVAGFDDTPFAARTNPPMTTVRQPISRVGAVAVETLISRIEKSSLGTQRIILPTEMVIRETCCSVSIKQKNGINGGNHD